MTLCWGSHCDISCMACIIVKRNILLSTTSVAIGGTSVSMVPTVLLPFEHCNGVRNGILCIGWLLQS